jgi:imidazolonepropionase-like amidohydrolase
MAKGKVHCNPTLVLCASQTGEAGDVHEKFKQDPFAQKMLIQKDFGKPLGLAKDQKPKASFHNAVKTVKDLYRGGVPILVGTDAAGKGFGVPYGLGVHIEMHLLAKEVGMSASDVLKAATSNVADRLGFADRGRIQAGRKADLVLLEGDANAILSDSQPVCLPIKGVWRDGLLATSFQDTFIELR